MGEAAVISAVGGLAGQGYWKLGTERLLRVCKDDSLLLFHLCYAGYCIMECWGFCFEISAFSYCSICIAVCPVGILTNTPLPPFLTASSAEPSVSSQPACISPQASPESGPSVVLVSVVQQGADQVPPGRWWLWDLPGSSLCYRGGFPHWSVDPECLCVFAWDSLPYGWGSFQPIFGWSSQPVVQMTR